jgi:DNA-binding NtrC family response regulator
MKPFPPHFIQSPILLVNHECAMREPLEHSLATEGFRILTATNRHEALDLIRQERIELVIMNMTAPVTEGIGTIIGIHAIDPTMKIIAMSGGTGDFLPLAKSLGASAVLQMPFQPEELFRIIHVMLEPQRQVMAS